MMKIICHQSYNLLWRTMISNFGNLLLFASIVLSLSIIYLSNKNLKLNGNQITKNIFQLSLIQSTIVIICFFTLIAAFIVSDFSLITVYQNSHSLKPLFYKISGTWGNHEGSLLLWTIILSIFSFLFLVYNKNHPKKFRLLTLIIQNILIRLLILMKKIKLVLSNQELF